jgi:hypothetical protein
VVGGRWRVEKDLGGLKHRLCCSLLIISRTRETGRKRDVNLNFVFDIERIRSFGTTFVGDGRRCRRCRRRRRAEGR